MDNKLIMENQVIVKLRFKGVLPMNTKTVKENKITFKVQKCNEEVEFIQSRDAEFDYECIIQPIYSENNSVLFSQFEELKVEGFLRTVKPNFPPSLEQENEQLKVKIFELEQILSKRK